MKKKRILENRDEVEEEYSNDSTYKQMKKSKNQIRILKKIFNILSFRITISDAQYALISKMYFVFNPNDQIL